jgi:hypothetical protein
MGDRRETKHPGAEIYVDLPDEGTPVWYPVEAVHIEGDVYQITEINADPEDTRWAFNTGAKVRCRPTPTRDDPNEIILVAFEEIAD